MFEGINANNTDALLALQKYKSAAASDIQVRQKVQEEFLAIFYKELLKHAFKPSKMGLTDEDNNSLTATYGSDIMLNQLSEELVKNKALSGDLLDSLLSSSINPTTQKQTAALSTNQEDEGSDLIGND
ncbi:MAG: hypothetical protein QME05_02755 [Candidatus Margulisbacteria bacterium]|nr:hypothetical protein [Candidatus Margulisiibacteriota bacterium]